MAEQQAYTDCMIKLLSQSTKDHHGNVCEPAMFREEVWFDDFEAKQGQAYSDSCICCSNGFVFIPVSLLISFRMRFFPSKDAIVQQ